VIAVVGFGHVARFNQPAAQYYCSLQHKMTINVILMADIVRKKGIWSEVILVILIISISYGLVLGLQIKLVNHNFSTSIYQGGDISAYINAKLQVIVPFSSGMMMQKKKKLLCK
jgi:hypothetical protein